MMRTTVQSLYSGETPKSDKRRPQLSRNTCRCTVAAGFEYGVVITCRFSKLIRLLCKRLNIIAISRQLEREQETKRESEERGTHLRICPCSDSKVDSIVQLSTSTHMSYLYVYLYVSISRCVYIDYM